MARTQPRGGQILDGSIQRADLDVITVGQAVIAKLIAGASMSATSTGGDAGTGDVTVNLGDASGRIGVGAAVLTDRMIAILSTAAHPGVAAFLYGVLCQPTYPSTTTLAATNYYSNLRTAAAAFVLAAAFGYRAVGPTLGAGSAITTIYGFYADNQGAAGVGTSYGLNVAAQSGSDTNSYGARIDTGSTQTLWVAGDDAAATTAAKGIAFGSGRDASVYRKAANVVEVANILSAVTGFRVNNAATSGQFLRGDGTNFVPSNITAADVPESPAAAHYAWANFR